MSVVEATETEARARIEALAALAESGRSLTPPTPVGVALESVARAAAEATGAGLAIVRIAERDALVARAVSCDSDALPAELHGSRCDPSQLAVELTDVAALPSALAAAAARISATAALVLPLERDGSLVGSLELYRAGEPFNAWERLAARVAATQALVALTAIAGAGVALDQGGLVEVAGDALAAASDEERAAERILRLAARAAGAGAGWLWTLEDERLELAARFGTEHGGEARPERAHVIVDDHRAAVVDRDEFGSMVTLRLGAPPVGALQLRFAEGDEPSDEISKKLLDAMLVGDDVEASVVVHSAIEEFAQELAYVTRRFLKTKTWAGTERSGSIPGSKSSSDSSSPSGSRSPRRNQCRLNTHLPRHQDGRPRQPLRRGRPSTLAAVKAATSGRTPPAARPPPLTGSAVPPAPEMI